MDTTQTVVAPTLEAVDAHVASNPVDAAIATACQHYNAIKPILQFAVSLLGMFKPAWVSSVQAFMAAMDKECAAATS